MTEEPGTTLLGEADRLYALLPEEFTARRDARARELKAAGSPLAPAVKRLKRPTAAAWALNLLVRRDAEQVEQVLAVAVALREAAATLDGAQLRELTKQRRQLTAAVTTRARGFAAEQGSPLSESVAEQVEAGLTAAMLDEGAAAALRSGLLVGAPRATGVEAVDLAKVVAVPEAVGHLAEPMDAPARSGDATPSGRPNLRVVPDPDTGARARRAAQHALAEAERALVRASGAARRAQREVDVLNAEALRVSAELDEARRHVAEAEARAERVDAALVEAEEQRDLVELDRVEAERLRDEAKSELTELT